MSKARLIITAVVLEGRSQAEVARDYEVSKSWVSKLVARYRVEGDAAFKPRSRRPHRSPQTTSPQIVELIRPGFDVYSPGWLLRLRLTRSP